MYFYHPTFIQTPTGLFQLSGTVPQYLAEMLFADKFSVKLAVEEAKDVNEKGKAGIGIMAELYRDGAKKVSSKDLHKKWSTKLDEISCPMR